MNFKSVQMMLLGLLGACVCMGLSSDTYEELVALRYGDHCMLDLPKDTESLEFNEFTSLYGMQQQQQPVVLWRVNDPATTRGQHDYIIQNGLVKGHRWMIENVTQADSGRYTARGKDRVLLSKNIKVSAHTESHDMMVGEELEISFDLHPDSCHLTFFPEDDADSYELVSVGRLQDNHLFHNISLHSYLSRFVILIRNLQTSNSGRFELTDENGNLALVVNLKVMEAKVLHYTVPKNSGGIQTLLKIIGFMALVVVVGPCVCFCLKYGCILLLYCCMKIFGCLPPDDPAPAETDASAEETTEPVTTPPTFQMCSQPNVPSPYHEVPFSDGQTTPPFTPFVPPDYSDCLSTDPGPQFELKGVTMDSESTDHPVYTSDKFNFL